MQRKVRHALWMAVVKRHMSKLEWQEGEPLALTANTDEFMIELYPITPILQYVVTKNNTEEDLCALSVATA